jgi:hypothetical protein
MSTCQRIWIKAAGLGARGQRYRVTHNGVTLIERTKNPEFDAARALLALGLVGQVEVWRPGASSPAMRLDIEKGARLTVEEGDREGLRFVRWRPLLVDDVSEAVPCRAVSPRTGTNEGAAGTLATKKSAVPNRPLRPKPRLPVDPPLVAEI